MVDRIPTLDDQINAVLDRVTPMIIAAETDAEWAQIHEIEMRELRPLWQLKVAQNKIINAWERFGVEIAVDAAGYWHWTETDETGEQNGPFSPAFSSFEACLRDLESGFGPLDEQKAVPA